MKDDIEMYTEEDDVLIDLELDDGTTMECVVLFRFPLLGRQYVALMPADELDEEEGEILLYRFDEDENGEVLLDDIEDDDEYDAVSDRLDEIFDQMEYDELVASGEIQE